MYPAYPAYLAYPAYGWYDRVRPAPPPDHSTFKDRVRPGAAGERAPIAEPQKIGLRMVDLWCGVEAAHECKRRWDTNLPGQTARNPVRHSDDFGAPPGGARDNMTLHDGTIAFPSTTNTALADVGCTEQDIPSSTTARRTRSSGFPPLVLFSRCYAAAL